MKTFQVTFTYSDGSTKETTMKGESVHEIDDKCNDELRASVFAAGAMLEINEEVSYIEHYYIVEVPGED